MVICPIELHRLKIDQKMSDFVKKNLVDFDPKELNWANDHMNLFFQFTRWHCYLSASFWMQQSHSAASSFRSCLLFTSSIRKRFSLHQHRGPERVQSWVVILPGIECYLLLSNTLCLLGLYMYSMCILKKIDCIFAISFFFRIQYTGPKSTRTRAMIILFMGCSDAPLPNGISHI